MPSAARRVLHGLPAFREHLGRVHVTVRDAALRGIVAVADRVAPLEPGEIASVGGLRSTSVPRTVVDVARTSPFQTGVVMGDAALHAGLPVAALESAVGDAAGRRGWRRARTVVAFARGESASMAASRSRVTLMQCGIRPPVLQWKVFDRRGLAGRPDFGFPWVPAGGEVDGEQKYRDAMIAPTGAADAVIAEKRREDRVRLGAPRLGRRGYRESGRVPLLLPILARIGVVPKRPRITVVDSCSEFRLAVL